MQNDFEKDITQRLQDFSLPPQPEIWQRVEAALPPVEKKYPFVFWWLLLLPLLVGMAIWFGAKHRKNEMQHPIVINKTMIQPRQVDTSTLQQPPIIQTHSPNTDTIIPISSVINTTQHQLPPASLKIISDTNNISVNIQHKPHSKATLQNVASLQKTNRRLIQTPISKHLYRSKYQLATITPAASVISTESQSKKQLINTADTAYIHNDETMASRNVLAVQSVASMPATPITSDSIKTISLAVSDSAESKHAMRHNSLVNHSLTAQQAGSNKQAVWRLYFGAGKSLLYSDNYQLVGPAFSSPNLSTGSNYINGFLAAKSGLSLSIGFTRRMYFSSHWLWQLSARYQYVSALQPVGADTSAYSNVQQSWRTGTSSRQRSSTHQLLLLPHLGYTFRLGRSLSATPLAGGAGGWNMINNTLLSDYRTNRYIRSGYYSNKWYAAVDAGLELSWKNRWSAGVFYQAPLSNVAKPDLQSDYRWRVWQVHVGLPLFRHLSK